MGSSAIAYTIEENEKAMNTPKAIIIWWKLVKVPEIYIGESSFIIKGAMELNKPAQIPCDIRQITKVYNVGI